MFPKRFFPLLSILLAIASTAIYSEADAQNSVIGRWSNVITWPQAAVHAHVLPTQKIMTWAEDVDSYDAYIWTPSTGVFSQVPPMAPDRYNLYCSGHSFMPDGRLFLPGGSDEPHGIVSLTLANAYNPTQNSWTSAPDMNAGRYYPTSTALANGDVLVTSGGITGGSNPDKLPQVFQRSTWSWRDLTNALRSLPLYPWMFLAPNGKVVYAGPGVDTRYLNTAGTGQWTFVRGTASRLYRTNGTAVYLDGKVLIIGGGKPATATAEIIDLNRTSPSWHLTGSMSTPRFNHNACILPDGKVLVVGGTSTSDRNNEATAVKYAEMWDPATEQFSRMASMSVVRMYHSTALLLPDARVWSAGGDIPTRDATAQIYSPPYLFKGPRPTIDSAPSNVGYNQTFFVQTPNASAITKVTWIRLPSVTHSFDQNQRLNQLSFSQVAGGLNISTPVSRNACPPGHYMLFILNGNGVPSRAKIMRIN